MGSLSASPSGRADGDVIHPFQPYVSKPCYWDLIRSKPNLMGGYIWDWIDQGVLTTNSKGVAYLAYGGDFGDKPNSGNFCLNGVINSDRTPNPKTWE